MGKISRIGPLKYTPAGVPVRDGTLAVVQKSFGKESVGYHELFFSGDLAETQTSKIRIGSMLQLEGSLWARTYRNRKGTKVSETKVIVEAVTATSLLNGPFKRQDERAIGKEGV